MNAVADPKPSVWIVDDDRGVRLVLGAALREAGFAPREFGSAEDALAALADETPALLYTDVSRDGTELGPNVESTAALALAAGVPVLASGGVGTVDDLVRLAAVPGVLGTVVGRALYTGAISLRDALVAVKTA